MGFSYFIISEKPFLTKCILAAMLWYCKDLRPCLRSLNEVTCIGTFVYVCRRVIVLSNITCAKLDRLAGLLIYLLLPKIVIITWSQHTNLCIIYLYI